MGTAGTGFTDAKTEATRGQGKTGSDQNPSDATALDPCALLSCLHRLGRRQGLVLTGLIREGVFPSAVCQPWPRVLEHLHGDGGEKGAGQELKSYTAVGDSEAQGLPNQTQKPSASAGGGTRTGGEALCPWDSGSVGPALNPHPFLVPSMLLVVRASVTDEASGEERKARGEDSSKGLSSELGPNEEGLWQQPGSCSQPPALVPLQNLRAPTPPAPTLPPGPDLLLITFKSKAFAFPVPQLTR